MDVDSDFQLPSPQSNTKRKARHDLIESPVKSSRSKKNSKPTKKPRLQWVKKAAFSSKDEDKASQLIATLAPEGYSVVRNQPYRTKDGFVQVYKCSGKRRHGCCFQAKVVHSSDQLESQTNIEVFVAGDHWHTESSKSSVGLPPILKPVVAEGVKDGLLPAQIHRKLLLKFPKAAKKIPLSKVQSAAKHQSQKLLSSLKGNTIGDLYEYLLQNTLSENSGEHQFGVLRGWKAHGPADVMSEAADICFVMTTKNLLRNVVRQSQSGLVSFVDLDQTYSLNERGYPITVVGTVNRNHNFKLIAVGVSRHEDEIANRSILHSVNTALQELLQFEWAPEVAMSDRAGAISNAFKAQFKNIEKLGKCYFHVKKALRDNKWRFSSDQTYEKFEQHCSSLASFDKEDEFVHGLQLLKKKWLNKEKNAIDWFLKEWGTENYRCWYSGFTPAGLPNTNNSLERFNRALKMYVTNHQRLSFSKIITNFKKELLYHSLLSDNQDFPAAPVLNRQHWGKAQVWYKSNKTLVLEGRNKILFFAPAYPLRKKLKQSNSLTRKNLKEAFDSYDCCTSPLPNENIDTYLTRRRSFWILQKNGSNFSCNCPNYLQNATCKHSLGMSIGHKFVVVPPHWKCNTIEALKQRGRPRKVKNYMERNDCV
jgi:hypothetical protein